MVRSLLLGASLAFGAHASQPGAAKPVEAPMRGLTWGQLNFLHTTDTHGWIGGHLLEPQYSADWGDYISFSKHMRKRAEDAGNDLLIIDTGDRVEGNGLYDGSRPKGLLYYDLWAEQDVDLICVGNHELYQASTADREVNTTVPNFKDKYVASNVDYIDPEVGERKPVAQRFRKFKTKKQGLEIVAFGFLFDFTGNANNTVVQSVEDTIKEKWFQDAIREKPDLFLVVSHIGLRMSEYRAIFTALRKQNWHTPMAMFGGHAHERDARSFDSQAFAMASGRYFETIGFMSIEGIRKKSTDVSSRASPKFHRKYIDTNVLGMYFHTGLNETTFPTKDGKRVSKQIAEARKALDLDHRYGCAPKSLWINRARYPSEDSVYSWMQDEVFPAVVVKDERRDRARLAIMNTGGFRFDIFKGPFTRDSTYIVSPFVNGFKFVADVPYGIASKVLPLLNSADKILSDQGAETRLMADPEKLTASPNPDDDDDDDDDDDFKSEEDDGRLELRSVGDIDLIGGYTTKDDFGTDGDDTVHKALPTYRIPNCIQSQIGFPEEGDPETVDLIFIDFIQPWIIPALQIAGGDYTSDNVAPYLEGTMTEKIVEWIKENWADKC